MQDEGFPHSEPTYVTSKFGNTISRKHKYHWPWISKKSVHLQSTK